MSFFDGGEDAKTGNWLADHWRGNLSLGVSYWINGTLLAGVVGGLLPTLLETAMLGRESIQLGAALTLVALLLGLAIWLWAAVGIWRSADKHPLRGGSGAWATVAKVMVVLGGLSVLARGQESAASYRETLNLAVGYDSFGAPAKSIVNGGSIEIDGPLSLGAAARFESVLENSSGIRTVSINSNGGRIGEAKQIASLIERSGLDTVARGNCLSACTIVLMAGKHRSITPRASVGFHQGSFPGMTSSETSFMNDQMLAALRRKRVDEGFIARSTEANPSEMWTPTEDEMFDAGVLNSVNTARVISDLKEFTAEFRGKLPYRVDEVTTLERFDVDGMRVVYGYRIKADKSQIDGAKLKAILEPKSRGAMCAQGATKRLIDSGVSFQHTYFDSSGQQVTSFAITSCGG